MNSGYWKLGEWKAIPFFLHWSILLWLPYYWMRSGSLLWAAWTVVGVTLLLLAHELGHAIAAMSRGIKAYSIVVYVLWGECRHAIAYREQDNILIAWGGVLAQLCVLIVALVAEYALDPELVYTFAPVFYVFIQYNLFLVAINLIPVAPLDGYIAWRIIPLMRATLGPRYGKTFRSLGNAVNFRKRKANSDKAKNVTYELLDRLKKKK